MSVGRFDVVITFNGFATCVLPAASCDLYLFGDSCLSGKCTFDFVYICCPHNGLAGGRKLGICGGGSASHLNIMFRHVRV